MLDFTVISSKNCTIPSSARGDMTEGLSEVKFFLGFRLTKEAMPNLKEAIDRAIENAGSEYDALIDGVLYFEGSSYGIYRTQSYRVKGVPVNTREATKNNPELLRDIMPHSSNQIISPEIYSRNLGNLIENAKDTI
jgi:hypothetical protein